MSLHLPPRLCFGLVAFLLVGVLAMGNPFRCCRNPAHAAELPLATPVGTAPAASPVLAVAADPSPVPAPAVEPCPIPELAGAVIGVRHDAQGEPIWLLADGRRIQRSHSAAAPFEVVQPVAASREQDQATAIR